MTGLRTNYARIARDYDADRQEYNSYDPELAATLERALGEAAAAGCPRLLADIGCGTGTVLARFEAEGPGGWPAIGLDFNPGMLAVALGKLRRTPLGAADAKRLPLRAGALGCAMSTFAFHHFGGLDGFLCELFRVLAPGGRLVLRNILPREEASALVYRFFPAAAGIDAKRFPLRSELLAAIARHGFRLEEERVAANLHRFTAARYHDICRKRTLSQLDLISTEEFERGLRALAELGDTVLDEAIPVYTFLAARP